MSHSKFYYLFCLLSAVPLLFSCSGSSEDEEDIPEYKESINLRSCSVSENAEYDAAQLTEVTLSYSTTVSVSPTANVTLNNTQCSIASGKSTKMNVVVTLPALEDGTTYTLKVPSRTVIGTENNYTTAPAFTVTFKTKEKKVVTYNFDAITNSSATVATKKVYQFLLDNYGKTVLSGAMGGVAWANGFAEFINTTTGKYPAIVGYDYIHIGWSPANWIDYSDITPAKAAWDNGSIVQIGWHWNTPSAEGANINTYGASYTTSSSDVKSGAGKTTFDITQALTEGTWQNTFIKKDIEKVAGYLKLLQDAGIPVLFRPLHEAAGDYQQGAWFWWGAKGAPACKQLWIYLHDQLTKTYGLNNLIWVWTVQTAKGGSIASLSDLAEWYPGDEYCDIVGADLYFDSSYMNGWKTPYSNQKAYELVMQSVNGKKMVVLSECGRLPVASECLAAGQNWGYFMTWYGNENNSVWSLFSEWDSASALKTKMNNSGVSNRGDFSVK